MVSTSHGTDQEGLHKKSYDRKKIKPEVIMDFNK